MALSFAGAGTEILTAYPEDRNFGLVTKFSPK